MCVCVCVCVCGYVDESLSLFSVSVCVWVCMCACMYVCMYTQTALMYCWFIFKNFLCIDLVLK